MSEPSLLGLSRRRSGRKLSRRGILSQTVSARVEQLEPRWLLTVPAVDSVTKFGVDGQTISVWGSGFTGATQVEFANHANASLQTPATSFQVASDSLLTATVPSLATGAYDITVTNLSGTSVIGSTDIFADAPSISPSVVAATQFTSSFTLNSGAISDISVISTADFTPTGNLFVETSTGVATISYTGITGTSFTGCTVVTNDPFNVGAKDSTGTLNLAYPAVYQATNKTYDVTINNDTKLAAGAQNAVSYAMFWSSPGGTFYYLDNGKFSPVSSLTSGSSLPTYSVADSGGSTTISLPYLPLNSVRIVFGVGSAPNLTVSGSSTINMPAPNVSSYYDYIEATLDASGADNSVPLGFRVQPTLNINTSQVDQFGMPLTLTGMNQNTNGTASLASVGVTLSSNVARDAIFAAFSAQHSSASDPYSALILPSGNPQQPFRILNPGKVSITTSMALGYVFDDAIKTLFESGPTLTLTSGANTYTGVRTTVNISGNTYNVIKFTGSGISGPVYVYEPFFSNNAPSSASLSPVSYAGKPTAPSWLTNPGETAGQMVFGNDGVFTDASLQLQPGSLTPYDSGQIGVLADLENQIVAALNRGIANLYSTTADWQNPPGGYYPDGQVSNLYAKFLHQQAINGTPIFIDGKAYAIAYDDQAGLNPSLVLQNQSSLATTLGPWQTPTPPANDTDFLAMVYQDVLHRGVDPSGHAYWLGLLAGGTSRADVSFAIVNSVEHRTDIIEGFYTSLLNRSADAQAIAQCLQMFAAGWTASQIKCVIYGSQEYFQTRGGGTNSGFINALYQDELHRAADSQAQTAIGQALAAGQSRTYIATLVVGSPEAEIDRVNKYFLEYLLRPADPAGLAYWNSVLAQTGSDSVVEAGLLGSAEFYNRA